MTALEVLTTIVLTIGAGVLGAVVATGIALLAVRIPERRDASLATFNRLPVADQLRVRLAVANGRDLADPREQQAAAELATRASRSGGSPWLLPAGLLLGWLLGVAALEAIAPGRLDSSLLPGLVGLLLLAPVAARMRRHAVERDGRHG